MSVDVAIFAAKETNYSYSKEESPSGLESSLLRPQNLVKTKDGKTTIKLAEANYDKIDSKTDTGTRWRWFAKSLER